MNNDADYCSVLQLPPNSSPAKIKEQYRRLAKVFHPDRNAGDEWCEEQLKRVNEAYSFLSDPARNTVYDQTWTSENTEADTPTREWSAESEPPASEANHASYTRTESTQSSRVTSASGNKTANIKRWNLIMFAALVIWGGYIYRVGQPSPAVKLLPKSTTATIEPLDTSVPIVQPDQASSGPYIPTAAEQAAALRSASHTPQSLPMVRPNPPVTGGSLSRTAENDVHGAYIPAPAKLNEVPMAPANNASSNRLARHQTTPVHNREMLHDLTSVEKLDQENRMSSAKRLKDLGLKVDWQSHSAVELMDIENRTETANRLRSLGYPMNWQDNSASYMLDQENRITTTTRLKALGVSVEWKDHTASELLDWENRIDTAKRLAQKGIQMDWRKHSASELLDMEMNAPAHQ